MAGQTNMDQSNLILSYIPPQAPPQTLTLEETDGQLRVIFSVSPKWAYIFQIVVCFVVGSVKLATGITIAWVVLRGFSAGPMSAQNVALSRHLAMQILLFAAPSALFWWSIGTYELWMYRKWGRVPRVLTAGLEGLTLSHLGFWRMREKNWPASEFTAVEFRPIKRNLNWTRTVANLYIRRQKGRRLHFRLSSPDPQLPGQIAQRVAHTLGYPLT
jgi:hypothetical protein